MIQNWTKLKEKTTKVGFRTIITKTFKLPDGKIDAYDIVQIGKTAAVLALTAENKVILARQFRPGPEKILSELPGGFLDSDEDPEEAIKRELLEETGYEGKTEFVGDCYNDAYSDRVKLAFVATECHKVQQPRLEGDEFIEIVEMTLDEFKKHLRSGQLTDPDIAYRCLDHLKLV